MKNKFYLTITCLLMALFPFSPTNAEKSKIQDSIIKIQNFYQDNDVNTPWNSRDVSTAYGTGFVVAGKYIVTNAHVVAQTRILRIQKHEGTDWHKAKILFIAHDCDLALIVPDDESFFNGLPSLEFGDLPQLNSQVAVLGYPIGGDKLSVTIGVVSRIESHNYAHTGIDSHKTIQVDAAINPGNSGGPVLQEGKVIGVAFQSFTKAENTGYVIPTSVVAHFFKDIKDGKYDGYGELGFSFMSLENEIQREYFGLKKSQGVVVVNTYRDSTGWNKIFPDDVLLEIDGNPIAIDGTIKLEGEGRVSLSEIAEHKHIGDSIKFKLIRKSKEIEVTCQLKPLKIIDYRRNLFENRPRYTVEAGYIFQVFSKDVLNAGRGNWNNTTKSLHNYFYNRMFQESDFMQEREEFIIVYDILSDEINSYDKNFYGLIVDKVNGVRIKNLTHLTSVFDSSNTDFVTVTFFLTSNKLILEKSKIASANKRIANRYHIKKMRQLE